MRPPLDRISLRWNHWTPWALMEARLAVDPAAALAFLRQRHRSRYSTLRDSNISPASIVRGNLDDPRLSAAEWEFALKSAIERQRCRQGGAAERHARKEATRYADFARSGRKPPVVGHGA